MVSNLNERSTQRVVGRVLRIGGVLRTEPREKQAAVYQRASLSSFKLVLFDVCYNYIV
jgi:hypothetical protein